MINKDKVLGVRVLVRGALDALAFLKEGNYITPAFRLANHLDLIGVSCTRIKVEDRNGSNI